MYELVSNVLLLEHPKINLISQGGIPHFFRFLPQRMRIVSRLFCLSQIDASGGLTGPLQDWLHFSDSGGMR